MCCSLITPIRGWPLLAGGWPSAQRVGSWWSAEHTVPGVEGVLHYRRLGVGRSPVIQSVVTCRSRQTILIWRRRKQNRFTTKRMRWCWIDMKTRRRRSHWLTVDRALIEDGHIVNTSVSPSLHPYSQDDSRGKSNFSSGLVWPRLCRYRRRPLPCARRSGRIWNI